MHAPPLERCETCPLREGQYFCHLPAAVLSAFEGVRSTVSVKPGEILFREDEPAHGIYIVYKGSLNLRANAKDGRSFIMRVAFPGDAIGLSGSIAGGTFGLAAEAREATELHYIRRDDFVRFLDRFPAASRQAANFVSKDCQFTYDQIRSILLSHSASERVARVLLTLSRKTPENVDCQVSVPARIRHEDMAQLAGVSRETVTRVLGHFRDQGLITHIGRKICLKNTEALERLISG